MQQKLSVESRNSSKWKKTSKQKKVGKQKNEEKIQIIEAKQLNQHKKLAKGNILKLKVLKDGEMVIKKSILIKPIMTMLNKTEKKG